MREKHSIIIDNQLNYYKAQFHCEEEIAQRFKQLAISTMSENPGYLYFCDYDIFSVSVEGTGQELNENHYSHLYDDCVNRNNGFTYEVLVFFNEVFIIEENGYYFLETYSGDKVKL